MLNSSYLELAEYYGTAVVPIRVTIISFLCLDSKIIAAEASRLHADFFLWVLHPGGAGLTFLRGVAETPCSSDSRAGIYSDQAFLELAVALQLYRPCSYKIIIELKAVSDELVTTKEFEMALGMLENGIFP